MRQNTRLNCFSPPVMLGTIVIEVSLALYTLWRYQMDTLTRLAVTSFFGLAIFQVAEFNVCTGSVMGEAWSKVGFIAITALPPLGIHLMHVLAGNPKRKLVNGCYAVMGGFMAFFLVYSPTFKSHQCLGNYVIFQLNDLTSNLYAVYYYALLAIGMSLGIYWAQNWRKKGQKEINKRDTVYALVISYLVFLIPLAVVNTLKPSTTNGIPSIMCGFAVLYALILGLYIVPNRSVKRQLVKS